MIKKTKKLFFEHRYAIFIFCFMVIYNYIVVRKAYIFEVDSITYSYHLVDFSLGFCTKLLPGAIYNALFTTTDVEYVNIYFLSIYHIFILIVSSMLEVFIKREKEENRLAAFVIVMFFITGPATFSMHAYHFGMLDTYWLFFAVAFLLMVENKYLKWLTPVLVVLSLLVHVSAMISFVPFFALILLLEVSRNKETKKAYLCIFGMTVFLAIVLFAYFSGNETKNLMLTLDEFRIFISERNKSDWYDYTKYYDYALYRISYIDGSSIIKDAIQVNDTGAISKSLNTFLVQVSETLQAHLDVYMAYLFDVIHAVIVTSPVLFCLYKYITMQFKKDKDNKLRRFIWLCTFMLFPLAFIAGILCSPDISRWFAHGVTLLFALVIYESYKTDGDLSKYINKIIDKYVVAIICYFILYSTCIVDPYC